MSPLTKDQFVQSIRSMDIDPYPTTTDYKEHGEYALQHCYQWFETWGDAVEAAGYVYTQSKREKQYRFNCTNCDQEFRSEVDNSTTECSSCGERVNAYRSRLNFQGKNSSFYQKISRGPIFDNLSIKIDRSVAEKLEFPSCTSNSNVPYPTTEQCIYYLPGDERRAAAMFAHEFADEIEDCMRDTDQRFLKQHLDDAMFNLILEQYFWMQE